MFIFQMAVGIFLKMSLNCRRQSVPVDIVLPHTKFTKTEFVDALKSIAAIIGVVLTG